MPPPPKIPPEVLESLSRLATEQLRKFTEPLSKEGMAALQAKPEMAVLADQFAEQGGQLGELKHTYPVDSFVSRQARSMARPDAENVSVDFSDQDWFYNAAIGGVGPEAADRQIGGAQPYVRVTPTSVTTKKGRPQLEYAQKYVAADIKAREAHAANTEQIERVRQHDRDYRVPNAVKSNSSTNNYDQNYWYGHENIPQALATVGVGAAVVGAKSAEAATKARYADDELEGLSLMDEKETSDFIDSLDGEEAQNLLEQYDAYQKRTAYNAEHPFQYTKPEPTFAPIGPIIPESKDIEGSVDRALEGHPLMDTVAAIRMSDVGRHLDDAQAKLAPYIEYAQQHFGKPLFYAQRAQMASKLPFPIPKSVDYMARSVSSWWAGPVLDDLKPEERAAALNEMTRVLDHPLVRNTLNAPGVKYGLTAPVIAGKKLGGGTSDWQEGEVSAYAESLGRGLGKLPLWEATGKVPGVGKMPGPLKHALTGGLSNTAATFFDIEGEPNAKGQMERASAWHSFLLGMGLGGGLGTVGSLLGVASRGTRTLANKSAEPGGLTAADFVHLEDTYKKLIQQDDAHTVVNAATEPGGEPLDVADIDNIMSEHEAVRRRPYESPSVQTKKAPPAPPSTVFFAPAGDGTLKMTFLTVNAKGTRVEVRNIRTHEDAKALRAELKANDVDAIPHDELSVEYATNPKARGLIHAVLTGQPPPPVGPRRVVMVPKKLQPKLDGDAPTIATLGPNKELRLSRLTTPEGRLHAIQQRKLVWVRVGRGQGKDARRLAWDMGDFLAPVDPEEIDALPTLDSVLPKGKSTTKGVPTTAVESIEDWELRKIAALEPAPVRKYRADQVAKLARPSRDVDEAYANFVKWWNNLEHDDRSDLVPSDYFETEGMSPAEKQQGIARAKKTIVKKEVRDVYAEEGEGPATTSKYTEAKRQADKDVVWPEEDAIAEADTQDYEKALEREVQALLRGVEKASESSKDPSKAMKNVRKVLAKHADNPETLGMEVRRAPSKMAEHNVKRRGEKALKDTVFKPSREVRRTVMDAKDMANVDRRVGERTGMDPRMAKRFLALVNDGRTSLAGLEAADRAYLEGIHAGDESARLKLPDVLPVERLSEEAVLESLKQAVATTADGTYARDAQLGAALRAARDSGHTEDVLVRLLNEAQVTEGGHVDTNVAEAFGPRAPEGGVPPPPPTPPPEALAAPPEGAATPPATTPEAPLPPPPQKATQAPVDPELGRPTAPGMRQGWDGLVPSRTPPPPEPGPQSIEAAIQAGLAQGGAIDVVSQKKMPWLQAVWGQLKAALDQRNGYKWKRVFAAPSTWNGDVALANAARNAQATRGIYQQVQHRTKTFLDSIVGKATETELREDLTNVLKNTMSMAEFDAKYGTDGHQRVLAAIRAVRENQQRAEAVMREVGMLKQGEKMDDDLSVLLSDEEIEQYATRRFLKHSLPDGKWAVIVRKDPKMMGELRGFFETYVSVPEEHLDNKAEWIDNEIADILGDAAEGQKFQRKHGDMQAGSAANSLKKRQEFQYKVRDLDDLDVIAARFGVTKEAIIRKNKQALMVVAEGLGAGEESVPLLKGSGPTDAPRDVLPKGLELTLPMPIQLRRAMGEVTDIVSVVSTMQGVMAANEHRANLIHMLSQQSDFVMNEPPALDPLTGLAKDGYKWVRMDLPERLVGKLKGKWIREDAHYAIFEAPNIEYKANKYVEFITNWMKGNVSSALAGGRPVINDAIGHIFSATESGAISSDFHFDFTAGMFKGLAARKAYNKGGILKYNEGPGALFHKAMQEHVDSAGFGQTEMGSLDDMYYNELKRKIEAKGIQNVSALDTMDAMKQVMMTATWAHRKTGMLADWMRNTMTLASWVTLREKFMTRPEDFLRMADGSPVTKEWARRADPSLIERMAEQEAAARIHRSFPQYDAVGTLPANLRKIPGVGNLFGTDQWEATRIRFARPWRVANERGYARNMAGWAGVLGLTAMGLAAARRKAGISDEDCDAALNNRSDAAKAGQPMAVCGAGYMSDGKTPWLIDMTPALSEFDLLKGNPEMQKTAEGRLMLAAYNQLTFGLRNNMLGDNVEEALTAAYPQGPWYSQSAHGYDYTTLGDTAIKSGVAPLIIESAYKRLRESGQLGPREGGKPTLPAWAGPFNIAGGRVVPGGTASEAQGTWLRDNWQTIKGVKQSIRSDENSQPDLFSPTKEERIDKAFDRRDTFLKKK